MEETSILAGADKFDVFDNQSILFTPPPIAFSTDLKTIRKFYKNDDSDGSFIRKQDNVEDKRSNTMDDTVSGVQGKGGTLTDDVNIQPKSRNEREREVLNFSQASEPDELLSLKSDEICPNNFKERPEKQFQLSALSIDKCSKKEECSESVSSKDDTLVLLSNSNRAAVVSSKVEQTVLITDEAEPFGSMSSDSLLLNVSKTATHQSLSVTSNTVSQKPAVNPTAAASEIETDLKFWTPLSNGAASETETDLEFWTPFSNGNEGLNSQFCPNQHEEFVSSSHAAAQLAQDELDFKAENGIFAEDQMVPLVDSNETGLFDDPDIEPEPEASVLEVSIGERMRAYSSFLGSFNLSDEDRKRPTFGSECIKSPLTRQPQALLDSADDATLNDGTLLENQTDGEQCAKNDIIPSSDSMTSNCVPVPVAALSETRTVSVIKSPSPVDNLELSDKDADCRSFANDKSVAADDKSNASTISTNARKNVSFNIAKERLAEDAERPINKTNCKPNETVSILACRNETIAVPADNSQLSSAVHEASLDQSMIFSEMNVIAPKELNMIEVCCVGCTSNVILPLLNETRQWLDVFVSVISVTVDSIELDLQSAPNPFFLQSKMILEPQTTEGCRICFQPSVGGTYIAVLSISGIPMTDGRMTTAKTLQSVIVLRAVAEVPQIHVQSELMPVDDVVEFGEFQRGSSIRATITLTNAGLASVPLLLRVHSNSGAGYFKVCAVNNEPTTFDTTKVQCALAGCNEKCGSNKVSVTLECFSDAIASARSSSVDRLAGVLDIQVDTTTQRVHLKQVALAAAAGIARIHLPLELHNVIELDCVLGSKSTFQLPVKNAGTVSTVINFAVTDYANLFTVQPTSLLLRPGSTEHVEICFASSVQTKFSVIESALLMNVQLSGTVYEVKLCANVTIPVAAKRHLSNVLLLADRQFMFWGGVELGSSQHQMICFQNGADFPLDVSFSLTGSPDFCLLGLEHVRQDNGRQPKVSIASKSIYRLYISFVPLTASEAHAALHVSVLNSSVSYTIPLLGFGGSSRVAIQNIQIGQSNSYWLNVGPLMAESTIVQRVSLKNSGHRTAFVKAECYRDMTCSEVLRSSQISVQPNAFCLAPGHEKTLLLVMKPTQNDVSLCKSQPSIVGVIALYSGNEVLRKRLRKFLFEKQAIGKAFNMMLPSSVNFDVDFADENCMEPSRAPLVGNEDQAFRSSLTRHCLAIVGEPAQKYVNIVKADVNQAVRHRYEVSSGALQLRRDAGNSVNSVCRTASSSRTPSVGDVPEQDVPSGLQHKSYKSSSSSSKENVPLIVVQPRELVFDVVAVGSKGQLSVSVKNRDSHDHQLVVSGVHAPFHVKFKKFTLRARSYVTLPVDFRPTVAGKIDCLMIIDGDSRSQVRVKLSGDAR
jgi:hypothetical protein